jgi:hypothetical protein
MCLLFLLLPAMESLAQSEPKDSEKPAQAKRQAVGRLFSPIGTLLQRQKLDAPWQLPELYATLHSGDELLALPGARADVELREGDVRLSLWGNIPDLSPAPVLESAVTLLPPGELDFSFVLQRGRAMLENRKEKGAARGRIVQGAPTTVELVLEKGSRAALERVSQWPAGAPFYKEIKKGHEPLSSLVLIVAKGRAEVTFDGATYQLQGPAMFQLTWAPHFAASGPFPLKKLPDWLVPGEEPGARTRAVHSAVEYLRRRLAEKAGVGNLAEVFKESDPLRRRIVVWSASAIDEVGLVLRGLEDAQYAPVREAAVLALRHRIARGQAQDLAVYTSLQKKLSVGQAEIVMNLLHGFGEQERSRPETYDVLIRYLQHDQPAIRELARWNLYALVPAGKEIAYDAADPTDQRGRAQAAWRKLIPEGQVPRQP